MKALVIEDRENSARRIKEILSGFAGFKTEFIEKGPAARDYLRKNPCDIVITEAAVGGVSCLEINSLAKAQNPEVCVIIICALDETETAVKAVGEGAYDFIIRPAQFDKLENLLKLYSVLHPAV